MSFLVYAIAFIDGHDAGTHQIIVLRSSATNGEVVPSPTGHGWYQLAIVADPGMEYGQIEARRVEEMAS
jgi:hypothetical protein